jgi:death-on-curing protein
MKNTKTYSPELVIELHDIALEFSGGLPGFAANKSLDGALQRIDNHIFYEGLSDLFEIAALLAIAIAQGHVFNDGNKRTAFAVMDNFLQVNGYELNSPPAETTEMMVDVAEKKISSKKLAAWLKKYSKKV